MTPRTLSFYTSLFLGLTLILFALPLAPRMPAAGLDPSFAFALNMAVSQGLRFGREIVFTLGPYASTYTAMYHPATDGLMLLGGSIMGLGYAACFMLLGRHRHWLLLMATALVLAALLSSRDAFLLSYPLAASFALTRVPTANEGARGRRLLVILIPAMLSAPFGLLLIIKGSFAMLCLALLLLGAGYLVWCHRKSEALAYTIAPLITLLLLWQHAGQHLGDLPAYFITQIPVISGFTDAMSWPGNSWEIVLWCGSAALMLAGVLTCNLSRAVRLFLSLVFLPFLFVAFKAGFVRHDMHVIIASDALLIAACLLTLLHPSRAILLGLLLVPICWFKLDAQNPYSTRDTRITSLAHFYAGAAEAGWQRLQQPTRLAQRYQNSLSALHTRYNFPALQGSTDIYSVNQAELFASLNTWQPRPVFQSYSVYTPGLARLNRQHLEDGKGADNILFRIEPIDGRLAALEDGASWLALLNGYSLHTQFSTDYLLLKKRTKSVNARYTTLSTVNATLGQLVKVPQSDSLLFIQVVQHESLTDRLLSLTYKLSELMIDLTLKNGTRESYRFVPGMAGEPFLLSPAIRDTRDFALLFTGNDLPDRHVTHLTIRTKNENSYRHDQYQLNFLTTDLQRQHSKTPQITSLAPIHLSGARLAAIEHIQCEGQIDTINNQTASDYEMGIATQLDINGWNTVSGKDGKTPEAVFIGLTNTQKETFLYQAQQTPRQDVSNHFAQPLLSRPGFTLKIESPEGIGKYSLGVFRINQGRLEYCTESTVH